MGNYRLLFSLSVLVGIISFLSCDCRCEVVLVWFFYYLLGMEFMMFVVFIIRIGCLVSCCCSVGYVVVKLGCNG